jgi:hypothetical protein
MIAAKIAVAVIFAELLLLTGDSVGQGTAAISQADRATSKTGNSHQINVPGNKQWLDTSIDLRGGAQLRFTATGQISYPREESYAGKLRTSGSFGPAGLPRGFADLRI